MLSGRRLVADGCARDAPLWGLAVIALWASMDRLAYEYPSPFGPGVMSFVIQGLVTLSIALALIGYDRLAGVSGISRRVRDHLDLHLAGVGAELR